MNKPAQDAAPCCPQFDPAPWKDRTLNWKDKQFVKDRVRSFLHIPLNFRGVMERNVALIEKAGASAPEMMVVSDENSLWGADVYIEVTKEVPGAQMAALSGTFLAKAFEGPYKDVHKWGREMVEYVKSQGKKIQKVLFYYTTCPKCAKQYGKNYVVLLAQV